MFSLGKSLFTAAISSSKALTQSEKTTLSNSEVKFVDEFFLTPKNEIIKIAVIRAHNQEIKDTLDS